MGVAELERVTRLADSLLPWEKRRLIEHLARQLKITSLGGAPGVDPAEAARGVWPSKFAESRTTGATPQELRAETSPSSRIAGLNAGEVWMSDDFGAELPDEFWFGEQ